MNALVIVTATTLAAAFVVGAALFNRMVGLRNRAAGAWSDVDVQLGRRRELIPALVEVVRGYAAHEASTLARVASERSSAHDDVGARSNDETALSAALAEVLVVAEAYPELLAHERFAALHHALVDTEASIADARRYYNAVVRDLNTAVETFPGLVVAGALGVSRRAFFELDAAGAAAPASIPSALAPPRVALADEPQMSRR